MTPKTLAKLIADARALGAVVVIHDEPPNDDKPRPLLDTEGREIPPVVFFEEKPWPKPSADVRAQVLEDLRRVIRDLELRLPHFTFDKKVWK